mmetsp:Transcript_57762/g.162932  ORF Transcript_57762/g.162932 Transcript_57762/m.162932 type:complete len:345 (+) Transcript_57762:129-1163(+)
MDRPSNTEIDDFVRANDIDDRAANDLRDCDPEVQRKVLARGELSSARNPSAALLARIRDARASSSFGASGDTRNNADVEDFIRGNDVDESAADSLRSSSPTVQRAVLTRGELKTARNPSSALLARIRDAKLGVPGIGGGQMLPVVPFGSTQSMPALGPMAGYGMPGGAAPGSYPGMPAGYGAPPCGYPGMYPGQGGCGYGGGYQMVPHGGMYPPDSYPPYGGMYPQSGGMYPCNGFGGAPGGYSMGGYSQGAYSQGGYSQVGYSQGASQGGFSQGGYPPAPAQAAQAQGTYDGAAPSSADGQGAKKVDEAPKGTRARSKSSSGSNSSSRSRSRPRHRGRRRRRG